MRNYGSHEAAMAMNHTPKLCARAQIGVTRFESLLVGDIDISHDEQDGEEQDKEYDDVGECLLVEAKLLYIALANVKAHIDDEIRGPVVNVLLSGIWDKASMAFRPCRDRFNLSQTGASAISSGHTRTRLRTKYRRGDTGRSGWRYFSIKKKENARIQELEGGVKGLVGEDEVPEKDA
ncbi:hypothetical protein OF83DRAFT_1086071 [Amylostereum chailletii]|nr:hypothetical protein OF83DRAFT_1086071 [Amylostereum chailletii]